jgi:capsular polysaccharide biosynthesis protein
MPTNSPQQRNSGKERKPNQMTKILIAYIIGLVVGAGVTLCIVEQLLK